jgi:hypothetical protein
MSSGLTKPIKEDILGLMKYLKTIAAALPDDKREAFMKSSARISLEYIINNLEGKKGLLREITEKNPSSKTAQAGGIDGSQLAGTLSYLGSLSGSLPDRELVSVLNLKVQDIMSQIQAGGGNYG